MSPRLQISLDLLWILEMHEVLRQRHFLLHGKGPRPSHAPPGSETLQWLMFSMKVEGVLFQWYVYSHLLSSLYILICCHPDREVLLCGGVCFRECFAPLSSRRKTKEVSFWRCVSGYVSGVRLAKSNSPALLGWARKKMQTKIVPMDYKKYKL